jgi:hypothetical protein
MGGISLGQFFLIILVTTRLVRQWQNHHYQHSRLPSSTTLFFVLLAFTSTTTIGFIPTAAASCSGSKYGSLSNPFLNLGAFLPPDDGSSIGRRPYSLPLSPIVKVGDFWGARNLHFGWVC